MQDIITGQTAALDIETPARAGARASQDQEVDQEFTSIVGDPGQAVQRIKDAAIAELDRLEKAGGGEVTVREAGVVGERLALDLVRAGAPKADMDPAKIEEAVFGDVFDGEKYAFSKRWAEWQRRASVKCHVERTGRNPYTGSPVLDLKADLERMEASGDSPTERRSSLRRSGSGSVVERFDVKSGQYVPVSAAPGNAGGGGDEYEIQQGLHKRRTDESSVWQEMSSEAKALLIDGIVNGTLPEELPTIGSIRGGSGLFYAERINQIFGDSNSGKSWTAMLACVQQMHAGSHVVYVDYEDTFKGAISRLLALGGTAEDLSDRFHYLNPSEGYDRAAAAHVRALVERVKPTLCVVDSTGEALAADGLNPNADEDVARWFRGLPADLVSGGAAVVLLDHLPKSSDGRFAIGSQRKRAAVTGASYRQETVTSFSKAKPGSSRLVCAKDRMGTYALNQPVAVLDIDPARRGELARLTCPASPVVVLVEDGKRAAVLKAVGQHPGISTRVLRSAVGGSRERVTEAIEELVNDGELTRITEGQAHKFYRPEDAPKE